MGRSRSRFPSGRRSRRRSAGHRIPSDVVDLILEGRRELIETAPRRQEIREAGRDAARRARELPYERAYKRVGFEPDLSYTPFDVDAPWDRDRIADSLDPEDEDFELDEEVDGLALAILRGLLRTGYMPYSEYTGRERFEGRTLLHHLAGLLGRPGGFEGVGGWGDPDAQEALDILLEGDPLVLSIDDEENREQRIELLRILAEAEDAAPSEEEKEGVRAAREKIRTRSRDELEDRARRSGMPVLPDLATRWGV